MAYDGTEFSGWASQAGLRTVQQTLEDALGVLLRLPSPPALTCAGRTDAGVHARGQVCHVDVPPAAYAAVVGRGNRSAAEMLRERLSGTLPRDVRVRNVVEVPHSFDARFAALWRRYAYRVCDHPLSADPLRRHEVLVHSQPLDLPAMNEAAQKLLGEHDFAAFCRRREGASTVRRLLELSWARDEAGFAVARVVADAFCHSMVRALVGALLPVGAGKRPVEWPVHILSAGVRDSAVNVVPPHGLTLEEVGYPPLAELAARVAETRRRR